MQMLANGRAIALIRRGGKTPFGLSPISPVCHCAFLSLTKSSGSAFVFHSRGNLTFKEGNPSQSLLRVTGGKNGWSRKDGSLTSSIKEKGEIASQSRLAMTRGKGKGEIASQSRLAMTRKNKAANDRKEEDAR
jgi:hypothetical protein